MKTTHNTACHAARLLALLLLMTQAVRSQEEGQGNEGDADSEKDPNKVQYAMILPEDKTPELIKPTEYNPFEITDVADAKETASSEENQIGDLLRSLPVVGISIPTEGTPRVLLGDIKLELGQQVPAVLPGQNVQLKVENITREMIELVWVEKYTGLPPRRLIIPIDTSPRVLQRLPGRALPGQLPVNNGKRGDGEGEDMAYRGTSLLSRLASAAKSMVGQQASADESSKKAGATPEGSSSNSDASPAQKTGSLLNMFFGSQEVKGESDSK